jgi:hypothetical protein
VPGNHDRAFDDQGFHERVPMFVVSLNHRNRDSVFARASNYLLKKSNVELGASLPLAGLKLPIHCALKSAVACSRHAVCSKEKDRCCRTTVPF